jgi:hypothetical protein
MKRFGAIFASVAVLLVPLLYSPPAHAQTEGLTYYGPHLVVQQLKWRSHRAAIVGNEPNSGIDEISAYVDSITEQKQGTGNSVAGTDTIAAFSLKNLTNNAATSLDSMRCRIVFEDAGNSTIATGDSAYAVLQVSASGKVWFDVGQAVATVFPMIALLNGTEPVGVTAGASAESYTFTFPIVGTTSLENTPLMGGGLGRWPNYRIVFHHDISATTSMYHLKAYAIYESSGP